jgi:hypothetical protein
MVHYRLTGKSDMVVALFLFFSPTMGRKIGEFISGMLSNWSFT